MSKFRGDEELMGDDGELVERERCIAALRACPCDLPEFKGQPAERRLLTITRCGDRMFNKPLGGERRLWE